MSWFETPLPPEPPVYIRPNPEALTFKIYLQNTKEEYKGKKMTYGAISSVGTVFKMTYGRRVMMVTAGHVCEDYNPEIHNIMVETYGPGGLIYKQLKMVKFDRKKDICILSPPSSANMISFLEPSPLNASVGEEVETIGYANGWYKVRISGTVTGYFTEEAKFYFAEVGRANFTTIAGQSGSPVLNMKGQVIGLLIIYSRDGSGGNFIPISDLKSYIETEILHGQ